MAFPLFSNLSPALDSSFQSGSQGENPLKRAAEFAAKGKPTQAIVAYQRALESLAHRAQWPAAHMELGLLLHRERKFKEAIAQWQALADRHPNEKIAPKGLWLIATTQSGPLNDRKSVIKSMQILRQRYPRDPYAERALYGEALLLRLEKKPSSARTMFHRYLREYPEGRFVGAIQLILSESQ